MSLKQRKLIWRSISGSSASIMLVQLGAQLANLLYQLALASSKGRGRRGMAIVQRSAVPNDTAESKPPLL